MEIYKITNLINKKIYIGKDESSNPNYYGSGVLIKRSLNKYGKHNHKKEILEQVKTKEELRERERYWILKLESYKREKGYNISMGGDGGDTITNNPGRNSIIENMKARPKPSEEERAKRSNRMKINNPMHRPEVKARHLEAVKQREWKGGTVLKDLNTKQVTCPHCKKSGGYMSFKQFHFDRCEVFTGIKHTKPEYTCPHCGKVGKGASNMQRWHFENCKHKKD